jgi:hypothetical protein
MIISDGDFIRDAGELSGSTLFFDPVANIVYGFDPNRKILSIINIAGASK